MYAAIDTFWPSHWVIFGDVGKSHVCTSGMWAYCGLCLFNSPGLKLWWQAADKLAPGHGNLTATFLKHILKVYTDVISFAIERPLTATRQPKLSWCQAAQLLHRGLLQLRHNSRHYNSIKHVSKSIPFLQTFFCCFDIALIRFRKVGKWLRPRQFWLFKSKLVNFHQQLSRKYPLLPKKDCSQLCIQSVVKQEPITMPETEAWSCQSRVCQSHMHQQSAQYLQVSEYEEICCKSTGWNNNYSSIKYVWLKGSCLTRTRYIAPDRHLYTKAHAPGESLHTAHGLCFASNIGPFKCGWSFWNNGKNKLPEWPQQNTTNKRDWSSRKRTA